MMTLIGWGTVVMLAINIIACGGRVITLAMEVKKERK